MTCGDRSARARIGSRAGRELPLTLLQFGHFVARVAVVLGRVTQDFISLAFESYYGMQNPGPLSEHSVVS
jgi:hypothetical protein